MFLKYVLFIGVILPVSVRSAPTVHFQDQYVETPTTVQYDSSNFGTESPPLLQSKPHIVEPTWITLQMPPQSYAPPANGHQQPSVMPPLSYTPPANGHQQPPYIAYIPVPPLQQPFQHTGWPTAYYPNMHVLPTSSSNYLCNQQHQQHQQHHQHHQQHQQYQQNAYRVA